MNRRSELSRCPRRLSWSRTVSSLSLTIVLLTGCGSEDDAPFLTGGGEEVPSGGPCASGEVRDCARTLELNGGLASCFKGTQSCSDGSWSECQDGTVEEIEVPTSASLPLRSVQAISGVADCVDNPCDPKCQFFDEEPGPAGLGGAGSADPDDYDWSASSVSPICGVSDLCTTDAGAALAGCHACVDLVCTQDASCCSGAWGTQCVELVYTECAGTTPPPAVPPICEFGAFGERELRLGGSVTGRPTIGGEDVIVETTGEVGDIVSGTWANLRNGVHVYGDVSAQEFIYVESGAIVEGQAHSGSYIEFRNGTEARGDLLSVSSISFESATSTAASNAHAGSYIELLGTSSMGGDAQARTGISTNTTSTSIAGVATVPSGQTIDAGITLGSSPNLMGTVLEVEAPSVELPSLQDYDRDLSVECAQAATALGFNVYSDTTLPPGVYGDVVVGIGSALTLSAPGSYIFNSLRFYGSGGGPEAALELADAGAADPAWDVSVCGKFRTDAGRSIVLAGTATLPSPDQFVMYSDYDSDASAGGPALLIGDESHFAGIFIAPHGQIEVKNDTDLNVALWGKDIWSDYRAHFGLSPEDCAAADLFGSGSCDGSTELYADGSSYASGDVVHFSGGRYSCDDGSLCSAGGGVAGGAGYWPGLGADWASAWSELSPCPPAGDSSCPVELTLDEVPNWKVEPCRSGLDCQINHRCTEAHTEASCDHSKCVVGAALDAACDPCVQMICDDPAFEYCCSNSWDEACTDEVKNTCDAFCGDPTGAPCPPEVEGESICDYAIYSGAAISANGSGNRVKGGPLGSESCGSTQVVYGDVDGILCPTGSVYVYGSDYHGDICGSPASDGGANTAYDGASIGTCPTMTPPSIPSFLTTCSGADGSTYSGGSLSEGHYDTIQLSGSVLTLSPGDYTVKSLRITGGGQLAVDGTGVVNLHVCDSLQFGSYTSEPNSNILGGQASAASTDASLLNFSSAVGVSLTPNDRIYGRVATDSTLRLNSSNAGIYGQVFARGSVSLSGTNSFVDAQGLTGLGCQLGGPFPESVCSQSVLANGICEENAAGFVDTQDACDGADLAVGLGCGTELEVCNHGRTGISAGAAVLSFFPRDGQQFASSTPDPVWETASCTVTSAIPSGSCVIQDCPSLPSEELTVMVSADASASECSLLDNWSYSSAAGCSGGSSPTAYTETYEATCGEGEAPLWGLLAWDASTPGSSSIDFSVRAAESEAELSLEPFTLIKSVSQLDPGSQVCSLASTCTEDLSDLLSLGGAGTQPAFVELQIDLVASGGTPSLSDWQLTYSCQEDQ